MTKRKTVYRTNLPTVGTRYPPERVKLLDAIGLKRGDKTRSETVSAALDAMIEQHFPGATMDEAA